jgi:hypothetical protein
MDLGRTLAARAGGANDSARLALGPRELLLGSAVLAVAAVVIRPVTDVDFWWHVQTGGWILAHRRLPAHDLYTYTAAGHPWTDHEYLTEVLMWLVRSRLGLAGASIALGLVTVLGFAVLLRTAALRRPAYVVLGLGLILAALAGTPVWGARPQMVTFSLACLELYWLQRYLAGEGSAIRWFPLVMVLWANLHGGWMVAFVFLGLAIVSELWSWVVDPRRREHLGRAWRLGIVGLLPGAAVACTPNGLGLYLYPLRTQLSAAQQRFNQEWQTPNLHEPGLLPFFAMLLLLVVGFSLRPPRLFDLLLAVTTLGMALFSGRHIALFVAATTPALVGSWSDAWWRAGERLRAWRLPTAASKPLTGVAVAVGTTIARAEASQDQVLGELYPVAAVNQLMASPRACDRIFNDYVWGGYLIERLSSDSRRRIFIFGEADVMGDPLIYRYENVMQVGPGWLANLDGTGADCVLVPPDSPLAGALATRPDWRLAYSDRVAVIYTRGSSRLPPPAPRTVGRP